MRDSTLSTIEDVKCDSHCGDLIDRNDATSALAALIDPATAIAWRVPDLSQVWTSSRLAKRLIRNASQTASVDTASISCLLLHHDDPGVICSAAIRVALHKSTRAIPRLLELLEHDEICVVCDAAFALGHIGATEAIARLVDLLSHDTAIIIARSITALCELGARDAIPLIFALLWHENDIVVASAAEGLANLGDKKVIPRLFELLQSDNSHLLRFTCKALVSLQVSAAIPRITELLKHKDTQVVLEATGALADLNAVDALPEIVDLLEHDDPVVYVVSALAAGQLGADGDTHDKCLERLPFHLARAYNPKDRRLLSVAVVSISAQSSPHTAFLELVIDPYEDRRDDRIEEAFNLSVIQEILRKVLRERGRRRADQEEMLSSLQSEFWLAAREDPLFGVDTKRILQDLFPSIRRRLSGIAYAIVNCEHTAKSGKTTINGDQRRVWQNNNIDPQFLTAIAVDSSWEQESTNSVVELYAFLKSASQSGLITSRQERVFELLFWNGFTHEQTAYRLGVTRKTIQRDFAALKSVIRTDFPNPYDAQC